MIVKNKKDLWYLSEKIVSNTYISKWWILESRNWTMRWWELDIVLCKWQEYKFVEVKTINHIQDINNFITKWKKSALRRSIYQYLIERNLDMYNTDISVDFVFVKWENIVDIFENQEI